MISYLSINSPSNIIVLPTLTLSMKREKIHCFSTVQTGFRVLMLRAGEGKIILKASNNTRIFVTHNKFI